MKNGSRVSPVKLISSCFVGFKAGGSLTHDQNHNVENDEHEEHSIIALGLHMELPSSQMQDLRICSGGDVVGADIVRIDEAVRMQQLRCVLVM